VAAPAPAVAFGGRRIAWVCAKNRLLMELLERHPKGASGISTSPGFGGNPPNAGHFGTDFGEPRPPGPEEASR